ncbi:hypothetical protein BFP77_06905 [Maribacter sp. 4U21]|uniref:DUF6702 family protein n=1 Tax=Maribacter sp. 4U21 TaxID=1889779 RepID=UPI000C1624D4|nr:DUF6702 family protein [Maribacter sp. 4U21]PIB29278.1 hypothetical protein BFP77_06905 [Maribacter sp. 4U21]
MGYLRKGLLLLILPLFAFTIAHKFYISVTHVGYSEKDDALQVTTRVFIDDMNSVLNERYDISSKLGTDEASKADNAYFEKYLRTKFVIEINGKPVRYTMIGKEYDTDMIVCYLEVPEIDLPTVKTVAITNEMLTDLFDEQQNVLHIKIKEKKKSFVLLKSDAKGMLNL